LEEEIFFLILILYTLTYFDLKEALKFPY